MNPKVNKSQDAKITISDLRFLKNSDGLPVAVKAVAHAEIKEKNSDYGCSLYYSDDQIGYETGLNETITLIGAADKRLDLSKWKICCFDSGKKSVYCSNE